jgi:hypothetical protein
LDLQKFEDGTLSASEMELVSQRLKDPIYRRLRVYDIREMQARYETQGMNMYGGLDAHVLVQDCKRLGEKIGASVILSVIDSFQSMPLPVYDAESPAAREVRRTPERFRLNQLVYFRMLTEKWHPGGWLVVITSTVRKPTGTRKRSLHADDLLGPSAMRSEARQILLLERNGGVDRPAQAIPTAVRIKKGHRGQGPSTVPLVYYPSQVRFEDTEGRATGLRGKNRPTSNRSGGLDSRNAL